MSSTQRALTASQARIFTLGRVAIDVDGDDDETLDAQTKRVAVLVYLAVSRPRGLKQRDAVVAMFWPGLDQSRARAALRGAVHRIRRVLGADAIVGRGDELIGVDPSRVTCDAIELEEASGAGDPRSALERYHGDFLTGFHVPDAPAFDEWASGERQRLRALARDAGARVADQKEQAGDLAAAISAARRALEIDPLHEPSLRRVLRLLARSGDSTGALVVADAFESKVGTELGAVMSPETRTLVQRLRAGLPLPADGAERRVQAPIAPAVTAPESVAPRADPAPSERPIVSSRTWARRAGLAATAAAAVLVLGAVAVTVATMRRAPTGDPGGAASVYVASFEALTPNDSASRILALMASDLVGQGLSSNGGPRLDVVIGRAAGRDSALAEAGRRGATLAIVGRVYRDGPRLVVASDLVRVPGGRVVRAHPSVVVADTSLITGADSLRRLAMASVATEVDIPAWARTAVERHLPTYEAYRLYLSAREADRARDQQRAVGLFERAAILDTGFTDALRGLLLMRLTLGEWGVADSLLTILEARNRAEPRDVQLSDAIVRARVHNTPARHLEAIDALYTELGVGGDTPFRAYERATALTFARRRSEAIAVLDANPAIGSARTGVYSYWITFANTVHFTGDHERELALGDRGLREFPGNLGLHAVRARALAALGREAELGRMLDEVEGAPNGPATWVPGSVFSIAAREARAHGWPNAERDARARLLRWYAAQSADDRANESVFFGASSLLYGVAAWRELVVQSDLKIAGDSMTVAWHGYRGIAAAILGDSTRAAAEDRWLATRTDAELRRSKARTPPWSERAAMRARIAVARGHRAQGIALLREAVARGFVLDIEFHTDPVLAAIAADPQVRELIASR